MKLELLTEKDPILRLPCEEITEDFPHDLEDIIEQMTQIMYRYNGIGLAAPQVGLSYKLFIMYDNGKVQPYINPTVSAVDNKLTEKEGCLSFPGLELPVTRFDLIKASWAGSNKIFGHNQLYEDQILSGMTARCFQHEFDHLYGICFVDRVSKLKLNMARKRKKKLEKFRN